MQKVFLQWLKINILFFAGSFIVTFVVGLLFTDTLLNFVRAWGAQTISYAPTVLDPATKRGLFTNIIVLNIRTVLLHFVVSLLFLAPLLAVIIGVFYSLGFLSALDRGLTPVWHSPLLITIEVSFILLAMTLGSALSAEIFAVNPGRKEIINFWKNNWRKLVPESKKDLRTVLHECRKELFLVALLICVLILVGAWIEVFMT